MVPCRALIKSKCQPTSFSRDGSVTLHASSTLGLGTFTRLEARMHGEGLHSLSISPFGSAGDCSRSATFALTALQEGCGIIKPSCHATRLRAGWGATEGTRRELIRPSVA